MSNSQNKKNEQQNNLCTMSLTEQWEKGELEIDKNYYLRFADGTEEIQLYVGAFLMRADNEVVEVLAPVPSYEEYSRLEWYAGCVPYRIVELNHENRKLKELLKECRTMIGQLGADIGTFDVVETMLKIDNAIGEKK